MKRLSVYGIISGISIIVRQFLLPNPFDNCGKYAAFFNWIAGIVIGAVSFALVGLIYKSGDAPFVGSLLYLFAYSIIVFLMYLLWKVFVYWWLILIIIAVGCVLCYLISWIINKHKRKETQGEENEINLEKEMTNYSNYPAHRFYANTCIICFDENRFSWCNLTENQKKYLVESDYLDNAKQIDIKTKTGEKISLSVDEFKEWAVSGYVPTKQNVNELIEETHNEEKQICPWCGKELVLRTAQRGKFIGRQFYGCAGYPKCRFIKNI